MVTLRQLQFALSVERHQHFKRAAEECKVTPSALSLGIAELEKQLGLSLFERNNKQVIITPEGKTLLRQARRIMLEVSTLHNLAKSQDEPLTNPMRIGLIPTIAPFLLPMIMPALHKQYPEFTLDISEDKTSRLIERVRTGELDTAVIALPYETPGLNVYPFWEENFYAIFPQGDKMGNKTAISSEELVDHHKLLLLEEGHCLSEHAIAVCSRYNLERKNYSYHRASLFTLVQMVLGNLGTTLIPGMAIKQLAGKGSGLNVVPLQEKGPHRKIAFIARPNYVRVPEVEILRLLSVQILRTEVGDEPHKKVKNE